MSSAPIAMKAARSWYADAAEASATSTSTLARSASSSAVSASSKSCGFCSPAIRSLARCAQLFHKGSAPPCGLQQRIATADCNSGLQQERTLGGGPTATRDPFFWRLRHTDRRPLLARREKERLAMVAMRLTVPTLRDPKCQRQHTIFV